MKKISIIVLSVIIGILISVQSAITFPEWFKSNLSDQFSYSYFWVAEPRCIDGMQWIIFFKSQSTGGIDAKQVRDSDGDFKTCK